MTYSDLFTSGPARPARLAACTCTSATVATLAETLSCPLDWQELPDGIWTHTTASTRSTRP